MKQKRQVADFDRELLLISATELSLADRRLFHYLLHHALNQAPQRLAFVIPFAELRGVYGSGLPPVINLQNSLRRLLRTLVEYKSSIEQWTLISLLTKAELNIASQTLHYAYSAEARMLYTDPFLLEKCLIQAHFNQKYSNLLYDVLGNRYYRKQTRLTFDVADLKSRLQIPEHKLNNYNDFDRFALRPAVAEINACASFAVKTGTQRKGMKVTRVIFKMTEKRNINPTDSKLIIPPKRPRFLIEDPALEQAYAYLLNAPNKQRRRYFRMAVKSAAQHHIRLLEELYDCPDLWFDWIKDILRQALSDHGAL